MSLLESLKERPLKTFNIKELLILCHEIRELLIHSIPLTGGHLSSNLGVVELIVAIHYCFNLPTDSLVFDVSHQSYVHKILTGRLDEFTTLRHKNGLSGFTSYHESDFDIATLGHAGTAISSIMGIQKAKSLQNPEHSPSFGIAFVGDASIANGVSLEALNNIASLNLKNTLIILNDNQMSISKSVGGVSNILTRIISHPKYVQFRRRIKKLLTFFGKPVKRVAGNIHDSLKHSIYNNFFEEFDVRYLGPIDGHYLSYLIKLFKNIIESKTSLENPLLLHVITKKGKGYEKIEEEPEKYHGVSKLKIVNQVEKIYTHIFDETICELAHNNSNIIAITAAMTMGTGLFNFSQKFKNRFFDVGIAESHGVIFSSFLSYKSHLKPYIAIYSTFLQRAFDQIFQDVLIQNGNAPVFILDRAGFCGEDGVTHHGIYDIAYLKCFPQSTLLSPKNGDEFKLMLEWSAKQTTPLFIRFPKAVLKEYEEFKKNNPIELGKSEWIIEETNALLTIIAYGPIIEEVLMIKEDLPCFNLINLRFAKPLDLTMLNKVAAQNLPVFTLEEHSKIGGVGESIIQYLNTQQFKQKIVNLGIPDQFFAHATRKEQLEEAGISGIALLQQIKKQL